MGHRIVVAGIHRDGNPPFSAAGTIGMIRTCVQPYVLLSGRVLRHTIWFMFSFQKLAVFAAILVFLWLAFRIVRNMERQQKERERMTRPRRRRWFHFGRTEARRASGEVEMLPCRVCRNWVAADGHRACGREDCPWPLDPRTSAP